MCNVPSSPPDDSSARWCVHFVTPRRQHADRTIEFKPGTRVAGSDRDRHERTKARMHIHPAITAATLVLLVLAFVGTLTATGVLS